ncbi:Zn-ribbon domain-containing OB-fold protein, partial [Dactylosporangium matsuzakiense]
RTSSKLPGYTRDSAAFWTGGERGELLINRCSACGIYHHPPAPVCHACRSRDVKPAVVSGGGAIVSFTVNYQPWLPGLEVPFVVAYVALDEQSDVWLMTNIVGCSVEEVAIGARVRVVFEQQEEVWVPLFELERRKDVAVR